MDISTITFLASAASIAALCGSILIVVAKGLPIANDALVELGRLLLTITQPMRDLFNKDTRLAKALNAKGYSAEAIDAILEVGADVIEMVLHVSPEVTIEATPKAEKE